MKCADDFRHTGIAARNIKSFVRRMCGLAGLQRRDIVRTHFRRWYFGAGYEAVGMLDTGQWKWLLHVPGWSRKSGVYKSFELEDGEDGKVCTRMYGKDLGQRY